MYSISQLSSSSTLPTVIPRLVFLLPKSDFLFEGKEGSAMTPGIMNTQREVQTPISVRYATAVIFLVLLSNGSEQFLQRYHMTQELVSYAVSEL